MGDDVCAITFDAAGRPTVVPSYPRTRLWADAAALFSIDTSDLPRTRPTWDKFERQVWDQFWDLQEPLTHVFHLAAPHDGGDVALERLGPMAAFTTLVDQTYRGILLEPSRDRPNAEAVLEDDGGLLLARYLVGRTADRAKAERQGDLCVLTLTLQN
jgi:hypothetical protein